jgi:hypothetical protein
MRGLAAQVPVFSSAAGHGGRDCEVGRLKGGGEVESEIQLEPGISDRLVQLSPEIVSVNLSEVAREEVRIKRFDGGCPANRRASTALSDFPFSCRNDNENHFATHSFALVFFLLLIAEALYTEYPVP